MVSGLVMSRLYAAVIWGYFQRVPGIRAHASTKKQRYYTKIGTGIRLMID